MFKRRLERLFALFLVMALICSVTACGSQRTQCNDIFVRQEEPQETPREEETNVKRAGKDGWQQFFRDSFVQVLSDAGNDNRIYSPINLYLCLAMLSEISDGDTRTQITNLLGQDNQKKIRKQSEALYLEANHVLTCRVGEVDAEHDYMCALGNSLWLREGFPFQEKQINRLMRSYHADCYQGEMGTADMDKKITQWVNNMTGGKLKEQAGGIETDINMIMMLLSSIHFESAWENPFSEEKTKKGVFHGNSDIDGTDSKNEQVGDITCDFLHQTIDTRVMKTDQYMAVKLPMQNLVSMYIVLPNKGISLKEILKQKRKQGNLLSFCMDYNDNVEYASVDFSMPKFNIDSTFELREILEGMGVTDMFQETKADFTPLTSGNYDCKIAGIYVGQASQTSNMAVDENGCSVASYTAMGLESKGMSPDKQYKMNCDRPFLFMVTKDSEEDGKDIGTPLFTGVIQNLEKKS